MTARILLYLRWKLNALRMARIQHRLNAVRDENQMLLSETENLVAEFDSRSAKAKEIQAAWDASA